MYRLENDRHIRMYAPVYDIPISDAFAFVRVFSSCTTHEKSVQVNLRKQVALNHLLRTGLFFRLTLWYSHDLCLAVAILTSSIEGSSPSRDHLQVVQKVSFRSRTHSVHGTCLPSVFRSFVQNLDPSRECMLATVCITHLSGSFGFAPWYQAAVLVLF